LGRLFIQAALFSFALSFVIPGRASANPEIQKLLREIPGSALRAAPE
jgi:hypothetical protein